MDAYFEAFWFTFLILDSHKRRQLPSKLPLPLNAVPWAIEDRLFLYGFFSDYKRELRALNRELVLQFLELTDALIERPSQSARCVEDMTLLLRNIHHLLNSLRPHQVFLIPTVTVPKSIKVVLEQGSLSCISLNM